MLGASLGHTPGCHEGWRSWSSWYLTGQGRFTAWLWSFPGLDQILILRMTVWGRQDGCYFNPYLLKRGNWGSERHQWLAQGHEGSQQWSEDLNSGLSDSQASALWGSIKREEQSYEQESVCWLITSVTPKGWAHQLVWMEGHLLEASGSPQLATPSPMTTGMSSRRMPLLHFGQKQS